MITVSKPINGVTLNGDEWLLDDNGEVMKFETKEDAVVFLKKHGVTDISDLNFHVENN